MIFNQNKVINEMGIYIDLILAAGIMLGLVIFLSVMTKRKSKYGLNFKRVYCPVCGSEQPIIRLPKNAGQIFYGGNTCSKCLADLDKYGNSLLNEDTDSK